MAVVGSQFEVAAALSNSVKPGAFKGSGDVVAGDPRERWAHAGMSTGVMIGGSGRLSLGSSSK